MQKYYNNKRLMLNSVLYPIHNHASRCADLITDCVLFLSLTFQCIATCPFADPHKWTYLGHGDTLYITKDN